MPAPLTRSGPIWALLAIQATAVISVPAVQAMAAIKPAIENKSATSKFEQVAPNIYRGPLPKDADFSSLQKLGITTIVDLCMGRCAHEEKLAKQYGMQWKHVPLGYRAPLDKSVKQVLAILSAAGKDGPVFIHCRQGADRTGMMIAIYRIRYQNWSFDEAYAEMRAHRFKPWWFAMRETVESFDEHRHDATVSAAAEK
jgi:protein-tyrosine phosphatase